MSEETEVVEAFAAVGALRGLRWSGEHAAKRVQSDMLEAAGYDATSIGGARHSLFKDRLDRVFSCEKYAVRNGRDGADMDIVFQELSDEAIETFPTIAPGTLWRSNMTGSPGWTNGSHRVLIASAEFGRLRQIRWSDRSVTKQRVARQAIGPGVEASVLDALPDEFLADLFASSKRKLDMPTLILAHTVNTTTGERELVLGRPRDNRDGGDAWAWMHDLLHGPELDRSVGEPNAVPPVDPDSVPDVGVRLRRRAAEGGQ